jgi:hypothetical protein
VGFLLSGYISDQSKESDQTAGYDQDTNSLMLGFDYAMSSGTVVGAFINLADESTTYVDCLGNQQVDELGAGILVIHRLGESSTLDVVVNYSDRAYDVANTVVPVQFTNLVSDEEYASLPLPPPDAFKGSPDGSRVFASLGVDHQFLLEKGSSVMLRGAVSYERRERDAFSALAEQPLVVNCQPEFDFGVDDSGFCDTFTVEGFFFADEVESLLSEVRLDYMVPLSYDWGVLMPQAYGSWLHEFRDDPRSVGAEICDPEFGCEDTVDFLDRPIRTGFDLTVTTSAPDRDYFEAGLGAVAVLRNGVSIYAMYSGQFGRNRYDRQQFDVGLRLEF